MIEIRHLTKKYGENVAVNDLNLTLEPGNIYGFLGPNGAGKSTTMNILTGYIGATSGEVVINGHDINAEPEAAKQCIGYLPELPPVYGDMRVMEYLKFVAELKQLNPHTRMADIKQAMDLTKLEPVQDRLIRNLSKGYRQRVGLAQALMGLPEILILDEPTVGLDPKQIIEIRDLIKSLREGHTVILSSHILQEISAVCDHVFIISKGNLVASDSMENLEAKMSGEQQLSVTVSGAMEAVSGMGRIAGVKSFEILNMQPENVQKPEEKITEKADDVQPETAIEASDVPYTVDAPETADSTENEKSAEDMDSVKAKEIALPAENTEAAEPTGAAENMEAVELTGAAENTEAVEPTGAADAAKPEKRTEVVKPAEIRIKEYALELTAKPGADIRAGVFRYCVEHELTLLEMTSITKSLEDVFLELTDGGEVQ